VLPSLSSLFPPILMAVPKSRTTHGKKRMRASNKGIKNLENIISCPACHQPKLMHHVCPHCLSRIHKNRTQVMQKA
jgi:large subunit ribosomal protein L32